MITYDWRRCPAPSLLPDSSKPADTGLPRGSYESGPLVDEGGIVGYGPLSSDLGPRFGIGPGGDGEDGDGSGFGSGILDALGSNCMFWAGAAVLGVMALVKGK